MLFRSISTVFFIILLSACANTVKFTYEDPWTPNVGDTITIKGYLGKPEGEGPFPAVILLHGCSGINDREHIWASNLNEWGYVSLIVDSFSPRSLSNTCGRGTIEAERAHDAHAAKAYLEKLSYVDSRYIGIMGFSNGATTILRAIIDEHFDENEKPESQFAAAVAFYPYCKYSVKYMDAPLMVLMGEKDDLTPASVCKGKERSGKGQHGSGKHEATFVFYPNASHDFDWPWKNTTYRGHKLLYNANAAADAKIKVKNFFAKYLK
jgi:dienelactone hydrolase